MSDEAELREEPCGCKYHYDGAVPSQPATGRWDRRNRCEHHPVPGDGLGDWIHVLHSMWPPPGLDSKCDLRAEIERLTTERDNWKRIAEAAQEMVKATLAVIPKQA